LKVTSSEVSLLPAASVWVCIVTHQQQDWDSLTDNRAFQYHTELDSPRNMAEVTTTLENKESNIKKQQ